MKKLSIIVTLMASMLFSCGSKTENAKEEGPITLKISSWNVAAKSLSDVAKEYEKDHPNVKIELIEVDPSYTKITPTLVSGQGAPDIIQTQARDIQAFLDKFDGQFVDIKERLEKDGLVDKFLPSAMNMGKKDGKIFAFPWDIGPVGVYYRKDMFEKAGVKPEDIKTWDDFIEAGKKVQAANPGVKMTCFQEDNDLFSMLFNEAGGSFVKDGKINIISPEAKKALNLMLKMKDAGILIDVTDWNGRIVALNANKSATVIYPVWYAGTLSSAVGDQKGKWGVMELPAYEPGGIRRSNLGGSMLTISTQSKHPDAAYDFLKFALATNKGEDIMMSYGLFPSYTPYYDTENFKSVNPYFGMDINSFFAELTKGIPDMEHGKIMLDSLTPLNNLTTVVMSGSKDVDTALRETADTISRLTKVPINK